MKNIPENNSSVNKNYNKNFKAPLIIPPSFFNFGWFTYLMPTERSVYFAVKRFENSRTHLAHPSEKTLADLTELNESTIKRTLTKLQLFGILRIHTIKAGRLRRFNCYYLYPNLHPITKEALGQIRLYHAEIQKWKEEKRKNKTKNLPKGYYSRLARSSHRIKDIVGPVLASLRSKSQSA